MIKWFVLIFIAGPRIIYSDIKCAIMAKHKDKYSLQQRYNVVRNTVIWVNKLTRRRYKLDNVEVINKPHDKGRIYVCNHFHVFEVLALIELSEKPLVFLSKIENKKTPFLRVHMKAVDTFVIDRDDVRQSIRVCKDAGLLASSGYNVVIFAEGTRSKDGSVAPFRGALTMLVHYSKSETVLVCMHNQELPLKFRWIKYPKEYVSIKFFEPLSYDFFVENRKDFTVITHDIIANQLDKFKKEDNL